MNIVENYLAKQYLDTVLTKLSIGDAQTLLFNCACHVQFYFTEDVHYAAIGGKKCYINPTRFIDISPQARHSLIKHELWHTARGHNIRKGNRRHAVWNTACDLVINNGMVRDGDKGIQEFPNPCLDLNIPSHLSEEEIYEILLEDYLEPDTEESDAANKDLLEPNEEDSEILASEETEILSSILKVNPSCKDKLPTSLVNVLTKDRATKVDWKVVLNTFVRNSQKFNDSYGFKRPSRTGDYSIIYPRLQIGDPIPDQIQIYIDISGSVSENLLGHFAYEINTIKDLLPQLSITISTFNTDIVDTFKFSEWDVKRFRAGGGTNVNCVMEHIARHAIKNVVVFSDMFTKPVLWNSYLRIPSLLWLIVGNPDYIPEQGSYIHITED